MVESVPDDEQQGLTVSLAEGGKRGGHLPIAHAGLHDGLTGGRGARRQTPRQAVAANAGAALIRRHAAGDPEQPGEGLAAQVTATPPRG